jgi:hypothetical protein
MAIVACSECGNNVSDSAKACPHCGKDYPGIGKWSRRIQFFIGFVAGMMLIFWLFN